MSSARNNDEDLSRDEWSRFYIEGFIMLAKLASLYATQQRPKRWSMCPTGSPINLFWTMSTSLSKWRKSSHGTISLLYLNNSNLLWRVISGSRSRLIRLSHSLLLMVLITSRQFLLTIGENVCMLPTWSAQTSRIKKQLHLFYRINQETATSRESWIEVGSKWQSHPY